MTSIETEPAAPEQTVRRPLIREFTAELTAGDGRTIDVRIVPYGITATVSDGGSAYQEEWLPGCFDDQLRAANRVDVLLNFEHQLGIGGLIGRGTELRSEPDGLHGTFRMFETQDGEKALELVREGILGGVSLEAWAKKTVRAVDGTVRRVKAHLDKVALCRRPAFKDAVVLAVREEVILEENLFPIEMSPGLVARLRAQGVTLPDRYTAHPEETGTPGASGTPEDGTRQPEQNTVLGGTDALGIGVAATEPQRPARGDPAEARGAAG